MDKPLDVAMMKSHVESAMEALLRAADACVRWKQPHTTHGGEDVPTKPSLYSFLPGVYRSRDADGAVTSADSDNGAFTLFLHGDNTFEYSWQLRRPAPRAMEYIVEMTGGWHKPVLNRSRRGDDDQRVFLTTKRIRFQRQSNYDASTQAWKLTLHTLTRHGSDWAPVGESERGIPSINIVLSCHEDGVLESMGAALPAQVLNSSPACRVLAGLTKKVANKLGSPLDVMTEKWLPSKHLRLLPVASEEHLVRTFNPFSFLAQALRDSKANQDPEVHADSTSPIIA